MRNWIFFAVISITMLASCPGADNSEELIEILYGKPKKENQWGDLGVNTPNNIGNTFTADPKTTRTITWQSTINTGEVILNGNKRYPSTCTAYDLDIEDGVYETSYFHRVDITGLSPGKTYWFIVGGIAGAYRYYSPIYNFKTESTAYPDGFSVIHITDPQIGTRGPEGAGTVKTDAAVWKRTIEAAIEKCPDPAFIANTGDIVNNNNERRIPYYFDYAQEILAKYAFVYSLGNNDSLDWYNRYFYLYNNKYDHRNEGDSGVLYSFDYCNTHFISINFDYGSYDDDDTEQNFDLSTEQRSWLENDLANTAKKWKVVMMHKPEFARKDSANVNVILTSIFDNYDVDLVMAGHYHFYARSNAINWKGEFKENGTVWTIPNSAGTKYNDLSGREYLATDKKIELPVFTELTFTTENIFLNAYTVDSDGVMELIDTYSWLDY